MDQSLDFDPCPFGAADFVELPSAALVCREVLTHSRERRVAHCHKNVFLQYGCSLSGSHKKKKKNVLLLLFVQPPKTVTNTPIWDKGEVSLQFGYFGWSPQCPPQTNRDQLLCRPLMCRCLVLPLSPPSFLRKSGKAVGGSSTATIICQVRDLVGATTTPC